MYALFAVLFLKHKNQWEVQQREEEISQLQLALSDMQVMLSNNGSYTYYKHCQVQCINHLDCMCYLIV